MSNISKIDSDKCINSEEHPQWGPLGCDCRCHTTDEKCKINCRLIGEGKS